MRRNPRHFQAESDNSLSDAVNKYLNVLETLYVEADFGRDKAGFAPATVSDETKKEIETARINLEREINNCNNEQQLRQIIHNILRWHEEKTKRMQQAARPSLIIPSIIGGFSLLLVWFAPSLVERYAPEAKKLDLSMNARVASLFVLILVSFFIMYPAFDRYEAYSDRGQSLQDELKWLGDLIESKAPRNAMPQ